MPPAEQLTLPLAAPPVTGETPLVPARMVNGFVYKLEIGYIPWTIGYKESSMAQKGPRKAHREGISIMELADRFPNEESAIVWFESMIWPNGRHYTYL